MCLGVTIAPELVGEWKRYIDEIADRNSEKQRKYSEAATKLYYDHEKRVQSLKDEEESCLIASEEADRLVSSHILQHRQDAQRSLRFPWWNLDEPVPTIPEDLIENRRVANRKYHHVRLSRLREEKRPPDTRRYLGQRPTNEEPTMVGFLTWMANQGKAS